MKPKLSAKARVRADPRDGVAVLLSPERGLRLNETAASVVALLDGAKTVEEIIDVLAARYGADRSRVDADVRSLLAELRARALLDVEGPGAECVSGWSPETPRLPSPSETPVARHGVVPAPYTLVAELTHRCPLACPYCSNPRELVAAASELDANAWLRVVDEAAALGVMQMHLTGGEPLARRDLEPIAARARARGLYVNLVTSGIPLDRGRLERLAPSIDHVQLSVQDAEAASSDRIAGRAAHEAKMRVAGWVKDLGLPLTLNVVLHRANLDRVDAVIDLAERLGADRLELANVQLVSWAYANAAALLPTRAQIERARTVAAEAKRRLEGRVEVVFVLPDWHADRPRACMDGWGRSFVVVAPDGAVLPCHAARSLPLAFDTVRSVSLAHAWTDAAGMRAFRGEAWMSEPCRSCDRRAVDFGGCRCQAFTMARDARAADPACALSPHHGLVRAARERADRADVADVRWLYRGRCSSVAK